VEQQRENRRAQRDFAGGVGEHARARIEAERPEDIGTSRRTDTVGHRMFVKLNEFLDFRAATFRRLYSLQTR
jgi:hypothetical protein